MNCIKYILNITSIFGTIRYRRHHGGGGALEQRNWIILGVQFCFRRFPIDGFSGKW